MLLRRLHRIVPALMALMGIGYLCQPVIPQEKKPSAAEALSGTWRADISDQYGLLLTIRNEAIEMSLDRNGAVTRLWSGRLVIPTEHSDRHMDWTGMRAGTDNRALEDNKCLYRLSGDTLLVIGGGVKERPTRFYSGPGEEPRTLVFTRIKTAGT